MKDFTLKIRFRVILPLFLIVTLLTFPSTVTGSKYAWKDDITIILKINYQEQEITSLFEAPSDITSALDGNGVQEEDGVQEGDGVQDGDGVQIEATEIPGQWILSSEEDILPESLTVSIGEAEYTVYTNGLNNPEGIAFDPETGRLIVSDTLFLNSNGSIRIIANRQ